MSTITPDAPPSTSAAVRPSSSAHSTRIARGHLIGRAVLAVMVGGLVATGGYALASSDNQASALGPGVVTVDVGIDQSRFDLGTMRVQEGTVVRFVVHNADPIDHELVVGDAEVHRRHVAGSEQRHPPVPGEVSVAPGETAMTFYEFTAPGTITYACHLPGHEAYGMTGAIEVVAAS